MKKSIGIILISLLTWNYSSAMVYHVDSKFQLENVTSGLLPGDTVLLASKTWMNEEVVFQGNGTESDPIVFMAEEPGNTIFSGTSRMKIAGSFLVARDFIFQESTSAREGAVIEFRDGSSEANHCRLTNVTIKDYNPGSTSTDTKYVSLYGTYNRVDHCSFSGKTNSGATLVVWLDATPDYHRIDHNYFGHRPELGTNGAESIRIGTSDWESYSSNCIVEYNLFEECDGEIEIISNKSVGNQYRYNTFKNCEGTLTLRHGSDCWVYGNFFLGDEAKNCGGIRIIGPGHRVFNNYLENLRGTSYRAAICLANGVPNSPADRYRQVEDAKVGFNTIINCKEPFAIGAGVDDEKSLPPVDSDIENNLVITSGSSAEVVKEYDTSAGIIWQGNMTNATATGMSNPSGFVTGVSLPMFQQDGFQRPTSDNPAVGAAVAGAFDTLSVDIDGQLRPSVLKDVGCDQQSSTALTNHPLTRDDVGASYAATTLSAIYELPTYKLSYINGQLIINFGNEGDRTISSFSLDGSLLSVSRIHDRQYITSVRNFPKLFNLQVDDKQRQYSIKLSK
jgi:poly(beta-D-mannuronate) lyase